MSKLTRNPKQYYDKYNEITSKIDSAVECASQQNALKISETTSAEASKLSSISANGDEAVQSLVELVQKIGNQLNTLSVLANQYGSSIEPSYEKIQTQLKEMKKQEDSYKAICNDGPDNQNDKYYKIENNIKKFIQELYDTDVKIWNDKLDKYEIQLQNMCIIIDSMIAQLSSVNNASVAEVAESGGFKFQMPSVIPFVNEDMISTVTALQDIPFDNDKVIIGNKEYDIQYTENGGVYINIDGQKGINGYIISGMDGKKHFIYRQGQIPDWEECCNKAAAASIASAFTDNEWEAVKIAKQTKDGIGYRQKVTSEYFAYFGLTATVNDVSGKFSKVQDEILTAVQNKNYVMFHMDDDHASVGTSGHNWTGKMHWVAILDYKETSSGTMVFISDSGGKNSGSKQDLYGCGAGWYPLSEFSNLKIDHYTVISA